MSNPKYRVTVEENGPDGNSILTIYHDEKELASYGDYGEPEDNSFNRDWWWVSERLREAYKLGFADAIATMTANREAQKP
jgi:hypothetical protein